MDEPVLVRVLDACARLRRDVDHLDWAQPAAALEQVGDRLP
jgi:hypothetical protein